jgi:hypothetical protein
MIVRALDERDERVCAAAPTGPEGKQKFQVCTPHDDGADDDNNNKFMRCEATTFRFEPLRHKVGAQRRAFRIFQSTICAPGIRDLELLAYF